MDYAACNIIYVDRSAGENTIIRRGAARLESQDANSQGLLHPVSLLNHEKRDVDRNVQTLLGTFSEGESTMLQTSFITNTMQFIYVRLAELV